MKYKISKKKAEEFCIALCGTAKGLKEGSTGHMSYNFWLLDSRIYCQILVGCECISSFYFNLETC